MLNQKKQNEQFDKIDFNRKVHDRIFDEYENRHSEIFNLIEQARLHRMLQQAINTTGSSLSSCKALDYGCGSGNLTRHLIEIGAYVVAADVSPKFLKDIQRKYGTSGKLDTLLINGYDLSSIPDNSFDIVATYSVLHHVPDYLYIVKEMCRVCKAGGVIYIDHEHNNTYFESSPVYVEFCNVVAPSTTAKIKEYIRLLLSPSFYIRFVRKRINPKYSSEGDIHVWPDDHIQWDSIVDVVCSQGFEVITRQEYLLFKGSYPKSIYDRYADKCADMAALIARKCCKGEV
ncbi:MAG: class I SAM-dependent methyltransferase [Sedimentisphaerales bacterium]